MALYGAEEGWHHDLLQRFLRHIGCPVRPIRGVSRLFFDAYQKARELETIMLTNLMFEVIGSTTYRLALLRVEEARVNVVREHGEQGLLVNQLRAEVVDHADGARAVGFEQRRVLAHDGQVLVDEQTLVDNVDSEVAASEPSPVELQLVRRADGRGVAARLEVLAEEFKLLLRREPLQIHDGDGGRRGRARAGELAVGFEQRLEHLRPAREGAQGVALGEAAHDGEGGEDFVGGVGVGDAGRALAVQLDEAVGFVC